MFGPDGTVGSAGAGPRPAGTSLQTSVALSGIQSHGSPVVAFSRSLTDFALPVVTLAIHNSMSSLFVFRNASFEPSGENLTLEMFACGGTVTLNSLPSAIFFTAMA